MQDFRNLACRRVQAQTGSLLGNRRLELLFLLSPVQKVEPLVLLSSMLTLSQSAFHHGEEPALPIVMSWIHVSSKHPASMLPWTLVSVDLVVIKKTPPTFS